MGLRSTKIHEDAGSPWCRPPGLHSPTECESSGLRAPVGQEAYNTKASSTKRGGPRVNQPPLPHARGSMVNAQAFITFGGPAMGTGQEAYGTSWGHFAKYASAARLSTSRSAMYACSST